MSKVTVTYPTFAHLQVVGDVFTAMKGLFKAAGDGASDQAVSGLLRDFALEGIRATSSAISDGRGSEQAFPLTITHDRDLVSLLHEGFDHVGGFFAATGAPTGEIFDETHDLLVEALDVGTGPQPQSKVEIALGDLRTKLREAGATESAIEKAVTQLEPEFTRIIESGCRIEDIEITPNS